MLALDLSCMFPTRQEGTTPWFNFEALPSQKPSVPKHLFKNDGGDDFEDSAEILLEMFLARNFSHAIFHLTVNLQCIPLHKKRRANEFYYNKGRQGLDCPAHGKPSQRKATS